MSLQIGDWVRVKDMCMDYCYTVAGSIGTVKSIGHSQVAVDFKEFGPTAPAIPATKEFSIYTEHLEKIAPPAHLVTGRYAAYMDAPVMASIPKTHEEKIEILSRKIDSEEMLLDCLSECGIARDLLGGSWWSARDNGRVNLGYFSRISLPESCTVFPQDKYLHVSKCGTKVAFVENEDKQKRDIWTVMGYGRYLTKYHPELDNEQVKEAVNTFNYDHGTSPEVFFGETQDEFIRAINEGPSESCMQGLEYAGHVHPAAVYAAGDIKVAWLERDGRITARTLINKQTKAFSRVYGDEAKLRPLIEAAGYKSKVGALAGCRLLMIDNEHGSGYIMPYVDAGTGSGGGSLNFEEVNGFFVLNDDGEGESTSVGNDNDGVTESQESKYSCDDCGCYLDEDGGNCTYHGTIVCDRCLERNYNHALVGRGEHQWVRNNDCVWVEYMEEHVHEDYLGNLDVTMDVFSGEYIYQDDAVETVKCVWTYRGDCVECGTDANGNTLWLHKDEKSAARPGELFADADGEIFWHESSEVRAWVESEGEEGFDPEAFVPVRKDVVEVPKVEEVKAPDLKTEAKGPLKVGDMVEVIKSYGYGADSGWWNLFNSVRLIQEIKEETPTPNTWQAAYLRMQERGIKFLYDDGVMQWTFSEIRHEYKIDPAQTPPSDWQEIYKEAQASGVEFEVHRINHSNWGTSLVSCTNTMSFGSSFTSYRLKETA